MSISLKDQVECVAREIRMREKVYPGLVARGSMSKEDAERELAAMRAVLETLRSPAVLSQYALS